MLKWNKKGNRKPGSLSVMSVAMIFAVVAGCSTGTPLNVEISARPSAVLELSWAKAKRASEGIVVEGQIQQVHCCSYVRGHIHVEAIGEKGVPVATANVPWGEFNPRHLHSAWFKAALAVPAADTV